VNYRKEAENVEALLEVAVELGRAIDEEIRPDGLRSGTAAEGSSR
jgi:hypothetical protein